MAVPLGVLLAVIVMLVVLGVVGVAIYSLVYGARAKLRRRIVQVVGSPSGRKGVKGGGGPTSLQRRRNIQGKLKDMEGTRQKKRGWKLREEFQQAGLSITIQQFALFSVGSAVVCGVLGILFDMMPLVKVLLPVIGGLGLPRFVLRFMIKRRVKKFTSLFAESIDVIVRGIRSGLPVGECFNMVAREAPDPVGAEFRVIVEGQRMGLTTEEALQKAVERVPTAELRFFAIVLAIQQTTGGNLAETLAKLSDVLRGRKRMRDKIKAMSSEATSSAGIIGSLPVIVSGLLAVIAPNYIGVLFTSHGGHIILGIGLCVMGVGGFVMSQMINFDI
ncbi:MAG TPA: type II secretion system F family protein [Patescibacteria group bacterium]|nr:type II secretion system F family protein [Patescibacteria group bacterium]